MLANRDRALLEGLHQKFLTLEKSVSNHATDFFAQKELLVELQNGLRGLVTHEKKEISRLSLIAEHLTPQMTLKHFVGFMLPLERLLNKKLEDGDFLVTTDDREKALLPPLPLVFVLDNIRSAFNVGSIFRTAECLQLESIYLCGYTPLPDQEKVAKSAMGTESKTPWSEEIRTTEALKKLKAEGYRLIALETAERTESLHADFTLEKTALIFGNERFGLGEEILSMVDEVRIVPLRGTKNSLNVGVTAAIAGFEWMRQWNTKSKA